MTPHNVFLIVRDDKLQFRITAWPGAPLPLPPTIRMPSKLDPSGRAIVPAPADVNGQKILSGEQFTPSGETYLRLLDVDLDAPDEILEFVSRFGILGGAWAYAADLKALPYYEPALDLTAEWEAIKEGVLGADLLRANPPAVRAFANGELRFVETLEELRSLAGKPQFDNAWLRIACAETLTEFRFVARCLRDVMTAWRVFTEGLDPASVEWVSFPEDHPIETLGHASRLLTSVLPRLLSRFGPRIGVASGPQAPGPFEVWAPPHESTVTPAHAPPPVQLYQICALELHNHIVEQATYRICASETCQRTFVRQEGRAQFGQHRTKGVKYCSMECARAQAQREHRRRRRASA